MTNATLEKCIMNVESGLESDVRRNNVYAIFHHLFLKLSVGKGF